MLEGSRNERAALLVIAYLIGFTTAYIAFGVTSGSLDASHLAVVSPTTTNQASVIASQHNATAPHKKISFVGITKNGLTADVGGKEVIISATMPDPSTGILPEGYNTAVPDYATSPDGQYLYFCEQPSSETPSCRPYVYTVADGNVHPLTQGGARVAFAVDTPSAVWNSNGTLTVDGMTSLARPWQF